MSLFPKLGILLILALTALAIATPANAITITPANTAVSANSRNFQLQYGAFGVTRCSSSTFTGTTSRIADSRLSGRLTFGAATRPSGCTAFGVEVFIVCSGSFTIVADSTDGRGGGTVRFTLDRDFQCSVTTPGLGSCSITFRGLQANLSRGTYVGPTRTLTNTVNGIASTQDATNRTALCGPASGTSSFSGDYLFSTPANLAIT